MTYKYGTAGFRFNADEILKISQKIAIGCTSILSQKACHNNFLAIMITASHNPECDNGIKIINHQGQMIEQNDEQILEEIVNSNHQVLTDTILQLENNPPTIKILFGRDTRKSGKHIQSEMMKGFDQVSKATFIDAGEVSTPLLHHIAFHQSLTSINNYLTELRNIKLPKPIYVDCAGGVGARVLQQLNHPDILFGCTPDNSTLNLHCGSEHILTTNSLPPKWNIPNNSFGCSLDGDADRLVFWYKTSKKLHILDGDNQMALWAFFLKSKFQSVAAITTPYCNGATIQFLKSHNINVITTPTGIKNLHNEAQKYPNAVYFENNGHGTAHWENEIILKNNQKLVNNPHIGDGIYNIITTLQILEELNMSFQEWINLYEKKPVYQYKIPVENLLELETTGVMYDVVSPIWLKEYIERKSKKYDARIFLRKSGTEPIIRVYVESYKLKKIKKSITKKIK